MRAETQVWPKGTELSYLFYTDGVNRMILMKPAGDGVIPPPSIGGLIYQGDWRDAEAGR